MITHKFWKFLSWNEETKTQDTTPRTRGLQDTRASSLFKSFRRHWHYPNLKRNEKNVFANNLSND